MVEKTKTGGTPVPIFFLHFCGSQKGVASCSGHRRGSPTPDGHLKCSIDDGRAQHFNGVRFCCTCFSLCCRRSLDVYTTLIGCRGGNSGAAKWRGNPPGGGGAKKASLWRGIGAETPGAPLRGAPKRVKKGSKKGQKRVKKGYNFFFRAAGLDFGRRAPLRGAPVSGK